MKLSTKSRYGLRALFDIAYNSGNLPAQIQDISRRQDISPRYLEQIFQGLKKVGILKSKRGPQGGYFLTRSPEEITVKDIVIATEGGMALVDCVSSKRKKKNACTFEGCCVTQTVWDEATARLNDYFATLTLKTLCEKGQAMGLKREQDHRFMYYI
ncbi:MAG: Rrf2 family transcriptional regulator [Geobacteraceae bacterium]|nr:Rrf2 family transcriptional regulator [Geobacteraceae bacterium]